MEMGRPLADQLSIMVGTKRSACNEKIDCFEQGGFADRILAKNQIDSGRKLRLFQRKEAKIGQF